MTTDPLTLPWNTDLTAIPFGVPLLVRSVNHPVPFMAIRHVDFSPDSVDWLVGPEQYDQGIYHPISELSGWLRVA